MLTGTGALGAFVIRRRKAELIDGRVGFAAA
jgi:hypothetical protein